MRYLTNKYHPKYPFPLLFFRQFDDKTLYAIDFLNPNDFYKEHENNKFHKAGFYLQIYIAFGNKISGVDKKVKKDNKKVNKKVKKKNYE